MRLLSAYSMYRSASDLVGCYYCY